MEAAKSSCRPLTPCEERGFCGPFLNAERYAAIDGWEGIADCATCRNTVHVERHEHLWRRSRIRAAGDS